MKRADKAFVLGAALDLLAAGVLTLSASPVDAGSLSRPFSPDSPWNTPIDQGHTSYSEPNSIENRQFKDPSLANSWIQTVNLLFKTPLDAPVVNWSFDTLNDNGNFSAHGAVQIKTPANLTIQHGDDGWTIFTDPDGVHYWETWAAKYNASTPNLPR